MPSTTVKELSLRYMGRIGIITVLSFPASERTDPAKKKVYKVPEKAGVQMGVKICDVRMCYGNPHVLIQPITGIGSTWVSAKRVSIVEELPWEKPAREGDANETITLDDEG